MFSTGLTVVDTFAIRASKEDGATVSANSTVTEPPGETGTVEITPSGTCSALWFSGRSDANGARIWMRPTRYGARLGGCTDYIIT